MRKFLCMLLVMAFVTGTVLGCAHTRRTVTDPNTGEEVTVTEVNFDIAKIRAALTAAVEEYFAFKERSDDMNQDEYKREMEQREQRIQNLQNVLRQLESLRNVLSPPDEEVEATGKVSTPKTAAPNSPTRDGG